MKFVEKELNAGIDLDFGDFVLFSGKKEIAIISYDDEENCCLTFLSNGYVRGFDNCKCKSVKEFSEFLKVSYKGIRFIKGNKIEVREV